MTTPLTRKLAILLALSVALNLFVLSFMAGRWSVHREEPEALPARMLFGAGAMVGPGGQPALRSAWKKHKSELAPMRKALRQARRDVSRALRADPLDEPLLTASLERLRRATVESQQAMHALLLDTARELPVEQRRELATRAGARHRRPERVKEQ